MRSKLTLALAFVLALMVLGSACSKKTTTGTSGGNPTTPSTSESSEGGGESEGGGQITIGADKANDHGTKDVSGADEADVELDDFYFEPTVLKGTPGQQIKLELENEGSATHNFTLTDQSVDQTIDAGDDAEVTVTFPQSGMLEFFCKFHRAMGMVGALQA